MSRILLFLSIALLWNYQQVRAQDEEISPFKRFLALMDEDLTTKESKLDSALVAQFIPAEERINDRAFYAGRILRVAPKFYEVSITYSCKELYHCSGRMVATYDVGGEYLGHTFTSKFHGEENDYLRIKSPIRSNDLIIAIAHRAAVEVDYDETKIEHMIYEVTIKKSGEMEVTKSRKIPIGRTYALASIGLINKPDLDLLQPFEVEAMRYEIYASYGLTFEQPRWQSYFGNQAWYIPTTDNVDDKELTALERRNLRIINSYLEKK